MSAIKFIWITFLVILLTVLSQVGGMVYLLSRIAYPMIHRKISNKWLVLVSESLLFLMLYLFSVFVAVPLIARPLGRVALPIVAKGHVQPVNILTCLLNRHYVTPVLYQATFEVAGKMNNKYPGTITCYMDACFPFIKGFPLLPHLSHHDGRKLDLAFCYKDKKTGQIMNDTPSFIGYGVSVDPLPGETDMPGACHEKGFRKYGLLQKIIPQGKKGQYKFDEKRTRYLIVLLTQQAQVGKIFIEPHICERLGLSGNKIVFHGCHAVRHDDHIHFQLK